MTGPEVLDVSRDAIVTLVFVAAPLLLVGLVVGVVISLFQALTQIQEMTLVFVPTILPSFITLLIVLPVIGAMLGLTARLTLSALQVAGSIVAQQLGLGFVTAVDPTQGQQGIIVGNFLTMLGITVLFATNLHYLVIAALNDSYALFRPGEVPFAGDMAALVTGTAAGAFRIGVQLSAPFLVFGPLFTLGLGVLSRLMPQMQVFFVGMPASILIGFLVLLLVIGAMISLFHDYLEGVLRQLAPYS